MSPTEQSEKSDLVWKNKAQLFAQEHMRPFAHKFDVENSDITDFMAVASKSGLRHWWIPTAYGGAGATGALTNCLIAEELAWGCLGLLESVSGPSLPGRFILHLGNNLQKKHCLTELAKSSPISVAAFALTEESAGSDIRALTTVAEPIQDGFKITGKKKFITNGNIARFIVLAAKIKNTNLLKFFLIDTAQTGAISTCRLKTSGVRAANVAELSFQNYFVSRDMLLGFGTRDEHEDDMNAFLRVMEIARIGVAAAAIGVARAAWEYTADYSKKRLNKGAPLSSYQSIAFVLVDYLAQIQAARALTHHAANLYDQNIPFSYSEGNLAKLFAAEQAEKVVLGCSEILSAHGFLDGNLIEKLLRDVRVCKIWEGTPNILKMAIANSTI